MASRSCRSSCGEGQHSRRQVNRQQDADSSTQEGTGRLGARAARPETGLAFAWLGGCTHHAHDAELCLVHSGVLLAAGLLYPCAATQALRTNAVIAQAAAPVTGHHPPLPPAAPPTAPSSCQAACCARPGSQQPHCCRTSPRPGAGRWAQAWPAGCQSCQQMSCQVLLMLPRCRRCGWRGPCC